MPKQASIPQTQWTRDGRDLSSQAVPLYQDTMSRMDQYLSDPTQSIDNYLNRYYTNTTQQNEFLRNYNNAMRNQTAANYNATSGGYSSANQDVYDQLQRNYNNASASLYDTGVQNAYKMASNYYDDLLSAANVYNTAYGLGQNYSNIEQKNSLIDEMNSPRNQIGSSLGTVGTAIGSIWGPAGAAIGNAVGSMAGNLMSTDTSAAWNALGSGSTFNNGNGLNASATAGLSRGVSSLADSVGNWFSNLGKNKTNNGQVRTNAMSGGFNLDNPMISSGNVIA